MTRHSYRHNHHPLLQLIIAFASTMMFTACVNDIPYDAGIGSPKIVLNALLRPDSLLTATVGRTAHFLDIEAPQRLADATVTAIINGHEIPLVYTDITDDYRSDYTLRPGDEVTLIATHAIGSASATQRVMIPHPITVVHTAMQPFINPGDPVSLATLNEVDSALAVSLHIDDPADEDNYYRLTMDYRGTYLATVPQWSYTYSTPPEPETETGDTIIEKQFYPHYLLTESSSRLVTESESAAQFLGGLLYLTADNSIIFSDKHLRNGTDQPIIDFLMLMESPRGSTNGMYYPESTPWPPATDNGYIYPADTVSRATYHYSFLLETLSEDYYHYLNSAASYNMMGGTLIGEPTPIHSNIRGGLGIVGSYGSTTVDADTLYLY